MVALTSNLVMFTLYNTIQHEMPVDSSIKLIDTWILHGLLMPMIVFLILAINELLNSKAREYEKQAAESSLNWVSGDIQIDVPIFEKSKSFLRFCRILVPVSSVVFVIIFFTVAFLAPMT